MKHRVILGFLLSIFPSLAFATTPSVDASGAGTGTANTSNTVTASLTTTSSPDIIFMHVGANGQTTLPQVSSVSGASLTWTLLLRTTVADTVSGGGVSPCNNSVPCQMDQEVWWAAAASTVTAQTITVTYQMGQTPISTMAVFGVAGIYSSSTPFDINASLPAVATNGPETIHSVSGVSTTQAPDLGLVFSLKNYNNQYGGAGGPSCDNWVNIYNGGYDPAGVAINIGGFYKTYSSTQSGTTGTVWSAGCSSNVAAIIMATAVAGSPPAPSTGPMLFHLPW